MTAIETETLQTVEGANTFLKSLSADYRKNIIAAIESNAQEEKHAKVLSIQQEILSKHHMKDYHKYVLTKITDNLVENNHQTELEQLNTWIDFTERGWLIVHTSLWDIKFSPKHAIFDDINDIEWILEGKNILTENEVTGLKWLRANSDAVEIIKNTGKRIFSPEEYLAIIEEVFLWLNKLYKCNKVFFDVLWYDQYGKFSIRDNTRRDNIDRCLCTDTWDEIVWDYTYNNWVIKDSYGVYAGMWLLED